MPLRASSCVLRLPQADAVLMPSSVREEGLQGHVSIEKSKTYARFSAVWMGMSILLNRRVNWSQTHGPSTAIWEARRMSLSVHLNELHERHRLLETEIEREQLSPASDDLVISELKKKKLLLKEEIERLSLELDTAA
ncbi:DUF465 domain-containing protein [Candidatus Phaeomarinobacter ectocarpi]|nr:DUF465 domain-containing protein [Candidatus Phaeomarinobacter ectocarpi]